MLKRYVIISDVIIHEVTSLKYRSVAKLIEREHKMFCSYVKERCRYSNIVSFLKPGDGLLHSCHFVIRPASCSWSVMLVTWTNDGVRLSCSIFEHITWDSSMRENIESLFREHIQVGDFP
jgi:hypothetical protein